MWTSEQRELKHIVPYTENYEIINIDDFIKQHNTISAGIIVSEL